MIQDLDGFSLKGDRKVYTRTFNGAITSPIVGSIVNDTEGGLIMTPEGGKPEGVVTSTIKTYAQGSNKVNFMKSSSILVLNGDSTDITVGNLVYSKGDGTVTATKTTEGSSCGIAKANITKGSTKYIKMEVL